MTSKSNELCFDSCDSEFFLKLWGFNNLPFKTQVWKVAEKLGFEVRYANRNDESWETLTRTLEVMGSVGLVHQDLHDQFLLKCPDGKMRLRVSNVGKQQGKIRRERREEEAQGQNAPTPYSSDGAHTGNGHDASSPLTPAPEGDGDGASADT